MYQNFGKTCSLYLHQFHSLAGCDTVSNFFGISKTCVFQRFLKVTSATYLSENFGESAIVNEDLLYQVMSFIQKYVYRGKTNEEFVDARTRHYNTMKTKPAQNILPDPDSLNEHIKRANLQAYYWRNYLGHNISKVDTCIYLFFIFISSLFILGYVKKKKIDIPYRKDKTVLNASSPTKSKVKRYAEMYLGLPQDLRRNSLRY